MDKQNVLNFDGGRTFQQLAKLLMERGAVSVDLYCTFGIFSYGVNCMREYVENIYCHFVWQENLSENTDGFVKFLKV